MSFAWIVRPSVEPRSSVGRTATSIDTPPVENLLGVSVGEGKGSCFQKTESFQRLAGKLGWVPLAPMPALALGMVVRDMIMTNNPFVMTYVQGPSDPGPPQGSLQFLTLVGTN